uniref:39S ribosomal protein L52, mitochondrial isoform X1 n=2 Tax=Marmotini TaxID=337730 RepID=UPI001A9CEF64|nr:39S ribosomal protein L52, mitochondrial isoform X1 [Ictidomys tridecemlineatus]
MAEPVIENQIQDGGFRLPPLSNALCLRGHAHFRLLRHRHGCFGDPALRRCPEATLQRVGSGWQPVETPGLAANPSGYGPLTELPDWSYADGRPAPPMKGQLRRKTQREEFARRVVLLSQEMDAGIQAWQLRQQKLQEEERKQKNALKRKGASLQSSLPCP